MLPALVTSVLPPRFATIVGCGTPSCVCPPRIASIPVTREASFRSTSMPLCDSSTTACAPFARASSTAFCMSSSRMPNVQSGTKSRGWAIGVYGNAWPTIATRMPLTVRSAYGANTGSPKSAVLTFCAMNSIFPAKSLSMICLTRSAPNVNSQWPVVRSTPSAFCASTMSWPFVHSAVADPCQASPPSSSSAPGRDALSFFTSVARCAKPPRRP